MSEAPRPKGRVRYEGDPTLGRVMRRPKWIGALLLALLVAGVFAWLGQWQLGHAVTLDSEQKLDTEVTRPIDEATEPGGAVTDEVAGTVLAVSGAFVSGDFGVVVQRQNGGVDGAWVIGHFAESAGAKGHLAVAIGWAPSVEDAERALPGIEAQLAGEQLDIVGRYMPSDGPERPATDADPGVLLSMAPAQLVNLWQPFTGGAYPGYLVLHPGDGVSAQMLGADGLNPVDSVPPLPVETINWLNLFYAVEWVVFAGFAVFFWYRLARDDWEKEHELRLLQAADAQDAEE